jgi:hypothetical protein
MDIIKLFTYTVYAFVVMSFGIVLLAGYSITHGG